MLLEYRQRIMIVDDPVFLWFFHSRMTCLLQLILVLGPILSISNVFGTMHPRIEIDRIVGVVALDIGILVV